MIINYNGKEAKLPDFLIVGAAKSGTTSLHYYLKQHPQIFMPKVKELYFFSVMDTTPDYGKWPKSTVWKLQDYLDYFETAKNSQVLGEACPFYLYTFAATLKNIKKIYGMRSRDVKIIMVLRNPVERVWSHFMMHRRNGIEPVSNFSDAISQDLFRYRLENGWSLVFDYIGFSMYYAHVKKFIDEFSYVKIFLYDEFCKEPLKVVQEMFRFLGVADGFIPEIRMRYNVSGRVKSKIINKLISGQYPLKGLVKRAFPLRVRDWIKWKFYEKNIERRDIPEEVKRACLPIFTDDIKKLQVLIAKDLSPWLDVKGSNIRG